MERFHGTRTSTGTRATTRLAWCAAAAVLSASAGAVGQPGGSWQLTWSDEFGGALLDSSKWTAANQAGNTNNELQYYSPDEVYIENGLLRLRSQRRNFGGRQYTSGLVRTRDKFFQQYGRFEARIRVPSGQGIWPAFWMLPQAGQWPPEIDILEVKGQEPTRTYQTHHWGVWPNVSSNGNTYVGPNFAQDFHTFAVEWFPNRIDWYLDGANVFSSSANIPQEPFYIILNTAVGGDFVGSPNASTPFPQHHDIDYVRVYRWVSTNLLVNESFETPGSGAPGNKFAGWTNYGNAFSQTINPRSGAVCAKLFGNFTGTPNTSGVYQEQPTQPGRMWKASAWALHRSADAMQGGNFASIDLEWYNAAGAMISYTSLPCLDPTRPTDTWILSTHAATAPPNAARVRMILMHVQPAMAAGAVQFDDAVLELASCYPNCDGSTSAPVLTPNDFQCFMNKYTAGDSVANCDGSTGTPALTSNDFQCFLNSYAAGCS